jgi:putative methionine-R-sulfoxide reductase with GAF domain
VLWPIARHCLVLPIPAAGWIGSHNMSLAKGRFSSSRSRPSESTLAMSERLSPDRRSFRHLLSTLFQQIQRQRLRGSLDYRIDPECLPDLVQIRKEVKGGRFDLNAVLNRLTKLTQRVVGASGVGVWLFTSDEVFLYAGAGTASNDERLRLEVISKLARACQLSQDSATRLANRIAINTGYDASDPGDTNSLLVEPIRQGQNVAGALAALSDECNGFTKRDAANLHLLAGLLGQALSKAAEAGLQESITLEPAALLQLIERIVPALQRILESDVSARHSSHGFLQKEPGHDLPSAGIPPKPFQDSHKKGQEGATHLMSGTWTGDYQESSQLGDSPSSSSPLQETGAPRIGAWEASKTRLAQTSSLWPVARQKWERAVASARNYRITAGLTVVVQRGLRYAQDSILQHIKIGDTRLQMLLRSSLRASLKVAPLKAILAIAITFLILKIGLHTLARPSMFSSRTTARENTLSAAKSDAREAPVAEQFGTSAVIQVSHTHVTDHATEAAVRTLSPYEIPGLRRRAEYGDDSAAFEMGMAYEIGRGVPQQCATAAQWVTRAAAEGNTAAQYNLGLRYRDGDGVAVDNHEAVKWLEKAAAHRNSGAKVALGVLTAHQARVIPSSQASH